MRDVIGESPLGDVLSFAEAVTRLYALSVLIPAPQRKEGAPKLTLAPPLFEPQLAESMLPSVIVEPELEHEIQAFRIEAVYEDGGERLTKSPNSRDTRWFESRSEPHRRRFRRAGGICAPPGRWQRRWAWPCSCCGRSCIRPQSSQRWMPSTPR